MAGPVISLIAGILTGKLYEFVKVVHVEIESEQENTITAQLILASGKIVRITVEEVDD